MAHRDAPDLTVVEICAGAGGQSLGLHRAGFVHRLAVEIDPVAAETLKQNLGVPVVIGDVANVDVWAPSDYEGVDLFAGGVPCPPFSVAGKQLGSSDERDLFAWAVEQVGVIRPRAVMLENVRGLAAARFSGYRQRILDRLSDLGYLGEWRLIKSADFGVPQLRPRFVLIAMKPADHAYFHWPEPTVLDHTSVGEALFDLMSSGGWPHVGEWKSIATGVGPTLVGGSKKHGGADLGPTRAKDAWARLAVDGRGIANEAPGAEWPSPLEMPPRLTIEMAAAVQGWDPRDGWKFVGGKTSQYRQIGNAFPPPVARALGAAIAGALRHEGEPRSDVDHETTVQDPVYRALSAASSPLTLQDLVDAQNESSHTMVERKLAAIRRDFELEVTVGDDGRALYRLGQFKGFTGQSDHARHRFVSQSRNRVS